MGCKKETDEQMAAMARMVRDHGQPERDSRGRMLPLRYWAALARVEGAAAKKGSKQ